MGGLGSSPVPKLALSKDAVLMTKRVRAAEALGVRVNETSLEVLRYLNRSGRPITAAVAEFCEVTGKSKASIQSSLRALTGEGLLEIHHRYLANGGRLENEYEVTELGSQVIKAAAEEAGKASGE